MKKSFLYRAVPQKNGVVPWTVATIVVMYTFLCIGCDNVPPLNPCSNYQLPQSREVEVDYKTKAKLASDFALEIEGIKKQLSGKVNRDLLLEIEQATGCRENTVIRERDSLSQVLLSIQEVVEACEHEPNSIKNA